MFWRFDKIARMRDPRPKRADREGETDADRRPGARKTRKRESKIIVQKDSWDCRSIPFTSPLHLSDGNRPKGVHITPIISVIPCHG